MHRPMMPAAKRDYELIADLAAERARLREPKMVRVRGLAAADEARLLGDIAQVLPVAIAPRRGNREDTLVNASGVIIFSPGSLRLLLRRLLGGHGTLSHGNVVYGGRREARHFLLERVLEDFGIARNELVFGGQCASRPHNGRIGGCETCDFSQKFIAQRGRLACIEHRGVFGAPQSPISGSSGRRPKSILSRMGLMAGCWSTGGEVRSI